jgi:protein-S-isoprenylcysteine O-methyltransferase Ste14
VERATETGPTTRLPRAVLSVGGRLALVALFAAFAWSNFAHWRSTGEPSGFGMTLLEGWVAILFLVRRSPDAVSGRAWAWLAAPIGSFAMLFARPGGDGVPHAAAEAAQLLGVGLALVSLGILGRSFGLVAANRGIKTGGPYRIVRHPAYTGYLISYLAYVAENPTVRNLALLCVGTAFQMIRIGEEELVLAADSTYARYRDAVRYRLIPLVY